MTRNEIRLTIMAGLSSALVIVILGVLDALTLAVFCVVLIAGGVASAIGVAFYGDTGMSVRKFFSFIEEFLTPQLAHKRRQPPPPPPIPAEPEAEPAAEAEDEPPPPTAAA